MTSPHAAARPPRASPTAPPGPLIAVEDLHVEFPSRDGTVHAASGVSYAIAPGRTLGVVGESGSGKSVSAQAILRILPRPGRITEGHVWFRREPGGEAIDLAALPERDLRLVRVRRRDISLIMQEPMSALSPVHTIGNQIVERLRLATDLSRRAARDRAVDLLDMVGIPNAGQRVDAHTFELSGGMRQRAMIAMALAGEPKLLIADEPTTAVDVTIQSQILRLLKRLQSEFGMAILMITHDLGVIASIAHRVAVMYRGRIVEQGPVADVFAAPRHPYTRGLIASAPGMGGAGDGPIKTIPGVVPHPFAKVPGCSFHPRCPDFIAGVCNRQEPLLITASGDHDVRCHLYASSRSGCARA